MEFQPTKLVHTTVQTILGQSLELHGTTDRILIRIPQILGVLAYSITKVNTSHGM